MLTADEALALAENPNVDERMEKIYSQIQSEAELGWLNVNIFCKADETVVRQTVIARLEELNYTVVEIDEGYINVTWTKDAIETTKAIRADKLAALGVVP